MFMTGVWLEGVKTARKSEGRIREDLPLQEDGLKMACQYWWHAQMTAEGLDVTHAIIREGGEAERREEWHLL
jgi:hypothetical protein